MKRTFSAILLLIAPLVASCSDIGDTGTAGNPGGGNPLNKLPETTSMYIIGASFAYNENTWFEMACEELGLTPVNRAVSGGRISDNAILMSQERQYTTAELDSFEYLAIMHVHNLDVCEEEALLDDYTEYELVQTMSYTQAFDYVIRRYSDDCRALEYDSESAWFGIKGGKPVKIILCTHWHDSRTLYNNSARMLAERWSDRSAMCEFDTNIGFTKDQPDPETGGQVSLQYACDTEYVYGVLHGWHPIRGRNSEIQQRMARIFVDAVRSYGSQAE